MSVPAGPEKKFVVLCQAFVDYPDVTQPAGGNSLGSSALKVRNKIFAMLTRGRLVVKLPRWRVDGLVEAGEGERFDPGHGRLMREWFSLNAESQLDWSAIASEAREFVGRG